MKRFVSRALDWHVREQVEYNRALVECINAVIEALNESNRAVTRLAARQDSLASQQDSMASQQESLRESLASAIEGEVRELKDIRTHWEQWRQGWAQKLVYTEIQFLRGLADIRGAFDQAHGAPMRYHRTELRQWGPNVEVMWEVKRFEIVADN